MSITTLLVGGAAVLSAAPASAAVPPPGRHVAVGGFATASGGFGVVFADASVRPAPFGDAFALHPGPPMTGGASVPGGGYWEVGADGGVFSYGTPFFGSMGGTRLNQPVFSMSATKSGHGYWLVARDGGIFSFGDARFFGSAGDLVLRQPVAGITTTATGRGYRLVARDGGIFDYGDAAFRGSLPGLGVHVTDVVGAASTPSGNGYWVVRSNGRVYAFGDARAFANATPSPCDAITAIIANPSAQGYRLVRASGSTVAFGVAPGGSQPSGAASRCGKVTARLELPATTIVSGATMTGYLVVDNQTGAPLDTTVGGLCQPRWSVILGNAKIPNFPPIATICYLGALVFPVGQSQWSFNVTASYVTWEGNCGRQCPPGLPPDQYSVTFRFGGNGFPAVASVPLRVVARG